ncbi:MAG: PCRF domain-containing protein [Syntrophomonadaceae bacterium]
MDGKKAQIEILQEKTIKPDFWDDNQQAQLILKEISELQDTVKQYQEMYSSVEYIQDMLEIAEAENEKELIEETIKELCTKLNPHNYTINAHTTYKYCVL